MRIELFQNLYKQYSRLSLTFPADKPIAIRGIENRLMRTFNTTGGHGIFDRYLHRSLLWQRSREPLKRILVPSWSWMAYDGPIDYMSISFGQVTWSEDIASPFVKAVQPGASGQIESEELSVSPLEIRAPCWDIVDTNGGRMVLDDQNRQFTETLQCAVVGKSKAEFSDDNHTYYVLLVYPITSVKKDWVSYERVGVAVLERRQIAFEEPCKQGRIQ
jgi:hypothetical protein